MEAIILAGGFGTRLRPLTYTRAKALLPILNKPMVTYLIDSLPKEINKVIIAVNYRKDQIEQYFKEHDQGKEIVINDEPEPLGTGGAAKFAQKHITGRFFVMNADIICSLDLQEMIRFHEKNHAVTTISLWPVQNVSEFGVVDIKNDGNVTRFVEKPKPEDAPSNLINAGAYLLEPEVLDYIETGRLISMEKEIFPQIINDTGKFYGFQFEGYWIDVGRIQSYLDVHHLLMRKYKLPNVKGMHCTIKGKLVDSCLGKNVHVGDHTNIRSSVVFDSAYIGHNVTVANCVLGEGCSIGDFSTLRDVVVGDHEHVRDHTVIEKTMVWTQPLPKGYPMKQVGNVIGEK